MSDAPTDPTALVHSTMPLCAHLGVRGVRADSAGAVAAFLNLPEGAAGTSTISSATSFLRGVQEGAVVTATCTVLHAGRSTIAVETAVTDDDGRLMAKVTQTQAVLRPRG